MADFSIGDALGSGFGLMGKRPLSVFAWGLTYVVIGVALPLGLLIWTAGPEFLGLFQHFHPGGMAQPAVVEQVFGPLHAKLMLLQPIMFVAALAAQAILTAAVFRATLEPRNRGLAYLRIGPRELWLALLNFVIRILAMVLLVVLALVGLALGFGLNVVFEGQHLDWTARNCAFAALGVVLLAIFIGVCVRFSLAGPMTFAESQFRLFESWSLTRRHGWKLFGLGLVLALVTIVIVAVFEAVGAGVIILSAGGVHWDPAASWALMQDPNRLWSSGLGELLVAVTLIGAYAFGAVFAISLAPWAVAYRELQLKPAAPPLGGLFAEEPPPAPPAAPAPEPVAAAVPAPVPPADHAPAHEPAKGGMQYYDADPHAQAEAHGHDDHGQADAHGHDDHAHDDHAHDEHGQAEAHGDAAPAHDDHGGHAEAQGHDDHGHEDHGHAEAPGHDDHGHAEAQGHDDHAHGEAHGHGDDHAHGDGHAHGDSHGHGDGGGHGH